ncbi:Choline/Carnitine o-acyltransferase-domain-containing protein [Lipomyces tetrasporus]|uniref:Choline/Carnitine o-acyltransferase-domain-containing protein n=1 Tax=Lipomyces tetrasporus TaxID=54092 RepID=A0AAD7QQH4_9ASCO|nr:Choline/Carnitine o-acyltransferase-domain-containing protein [Lipomyces tetrasporus]KAJ8099421.1 Choline/Carnitine o-acyltransferase-domain-containing protein [Lipomyces tetrasporus]
MPSRAPGMFPPPTPGITFAAQDKLQKLPLPPLEDTIRRYLSVVAPLQTPREFEETQAAAREFLIRQGPDLHARLQEYAATRSSYIEQFWYDSYLNFDNPVVLNLNPFFLLEDDPTPARNNQVNRAASLVVSTLAFVRALRREELPPDTVRGKPLCMYQYSRIFGTARISTENVCVMQSDYSSKHIVVLARSQFYWFDVLDDNSDLIMTEKDLAQNFETIINDAQNTPVTEAAKGAVGILTAENRRIWASLRDLLSQGVDSEDLADSDADNATNLHGPRKANNNNHECLQIIDSALFILCLDYSAPQTASELAMNMLCGTNVIEKGVQVGTCTNRWYDKLQIIVTKNGSAGINFEHTGVDGHTILRFVSDIYTDTILRFAKSINGHAPSLWASESPDPAQRDPTSFGDVTTTPHKLEWTMVPELSLALRFAETRLADLIHQNEFEVLEFSHYGMNYIKHMGFSPDAFVQMAFQAAYYALYGKVECTYEPAMTKYFLHGRTEAIRTVSEESVAFVRKFCEDAPPKMKLEHLRRACEKHVQTTKLCAQGLGQDRHLYALYCMHQRCMEEDLSPLPGTADDLPSTADSSESPKSTTGLELPLIFTDRGWDKLNTTIISTSNCGNPSLRLFGFGPTSQDGLGIGYIIKPDSISICASSKHRQTHRFLETLQNYFLEVRSLLRTTEQRKHTGTRARSPIRGEDQDERDRSTAFEGRKERRSGRQVDGPRRTSEGQDDADGGDMLGGYGYFDVGEMEILLRDMKGTKIGLGAASPEDGTTTQSTEDPPETYTEIEHRHRHRNRHQGHPGQRRREVGRKLRLTDI